MTEREMERVVRTVKRKYKIFANIALMDVPIVASTDIETAAVCGERVKDGSIEIRRIEYNPNFFDCLSFEQQVFVMAHETCHIAFNHFNRGNVKVAKALCARCESIGDEKIRKQKEIQLRGKYNEMWNIAGDACINAFLKKDGFTSPDGAIDKETGEPMKFVDIADGLCRNAEKIFDDLVAKDEAQERGEDLKIGGGLDDIDIDNYKGFDSHNEIRDCPDKEPMEKNPDKIFEDESAVFNANGEAKQDEENQQKGNLKDAFKSAGLSDIKVVRPVLSWKQLLIKSIEEETVSWSYRRASRYSPNARVESRNMDGRAVTEVVLDTSPSISDELLRGFLYQLLPLLHDSDIKVGCFAGYFSGFTELKTREDIVDFQPARGIYTNYEAAVTAFTPDKGPNRINKIVFTDGGVGMPQKTRVDGILWIVFGEGTDFKPISGKIIRVSKDELSEMLAITEIMENGESLTTKFRR